MSPELSAKIDLWRSKATANTLTTEEMKEAVALIRGDRKNAASKSETATRKRATREIPNADDLLEQLGKM